jgi:hypothetical protein
MTAIDRADHADPNGQEKRRPPELPAGASRCQPVTQGRFFPAHLNRQKHMNAIRIYR